MRVPLSWLSEMIAVRGSAAQICALFTAGGIEAEIERDERPSWEGVVTALLRDVRPHPDADRLTVTAPFDGTSEVQVVCGATNHKAGDIVALATVGTKLPNGVKIKRGKMRGEVSDGMLCSLEELGLPSDGVGILILPPGTPIGVPLADVLTGGEVVLTVEPTANRGDCLSVLGVARELAALSGWPLRGRAARGDDVGLATVQYDGPAWEGEQGRVGTGANALTIRLDAVSGCPRYACAILDGVQLRPSPEWMRRRLEAMGLRAINNVVDCTNYVMLELGNPLHAFDRRVLRGDEVVIRQAHAGERARTLDGKERLLRADDLVIADGVGVIAIAGVMGAENSEVRPETRTLLLEAAHFETGTVRRTAHRLKLGTEASFRFARGVDPELPSAALLRLVELLQTTAGGELDGGVLDLYPQPIARPAVRVRRHRIAGLLGIELADVLVEDLLTRDGLEPVPTPEGWSVQPPSYRFDLEREVDVLEELLRLNGYDNIPETLPVRPLRAIPQRAPGPDTEAVRDRLVALGLSEAVHLSFIDPHWLAALGLPEDDPSRVRAVRVHNPLSEVGGVLRPTLLASLLGAVARNLAQGAAQVRLFEVRSTFLAREEGFAQILAGSRGRPSDATPVLETRRVAGVLMGERAPTGWQGVAPPVDLFDAKGVADAVLDALGARGQRWTADGPIPRFLDPTEAAVLLRPGRELAVAGWVGRVAVSVLRAFDIGRVVYAFELDVDAVAPKKGRTLQFAPFSRFPGTERDLAIIVADSLSADQVLEIVGKAAKKSAPEAFLGVEVFDLYRGAGIPSDARSLALRLRFRAMDHTLDDATVDHAMTQVEKQLLARDGVALRA